MKLATALKILAGTPQTLPARQVFLACGFTPLHLQTYLAAHLQLAYPQSRVIVATGLYGDVLGNLARIPSRTPAAVVIEWSDLDPRLGFRSLGGWTTQTGADILRSASSRLERLLEQLRALSQSSLVTLALPSSPLAPVSFVPPWMADTVALGMRRLVAEFAARAAESGDIRILSEHSLALFEGQVFELKSELSSGFPYSVAYADFLAEKLAVGLQAITPKKGLITDLDDTLWGGLVGEDGLEGIHWTLEGHAQVHGLYQQMLASLAESGVLLGVASKNDPGIVAEAFAKLPLVVKAELLFPVEVSWGRKSHAVQKILATWNIGPQDVVFIDDSPAELEEVQSAFPELTCVQFKGSDPAYSHRLLLQLRNLFGKARLEAEDALRAMSIKGAVQLGEEKGGAGSEDDFIAGLGATLTMNLEKQFAAGRALDLVNKTNQFNLNGRRYELADWTALGSQAGRCLLTVDYVDKHGSLGKISVLSGVRSGSIFTVDTWVLSCRAFARRIEYAILEFLFAEFALQAVELTYEPTSKNTPLREFIEHFGGCAPGPVRIERETHVGRSLRVFHQVSRHVLGVE